jgi:23S rRNA pseudouridine2605 synthase
MIRAGRVAVNGTVVRELGVRADLARDRIEVDGERLTPPGERRTILLHKPRGVVSAMSDPEGRPTVAALVGAAGARLYPVGRLDVNTTGLLLLTNDGALAAALLDPRRALPRVYHAKVRGAPDEAAITRLRRGVHLPPPRARRTEPARVRVLERLPTKTWLEISVHEGHWRVVRRMCDAVGHPVEKLARVRFGSLALGELPLGAWRPLGPRELAGLRAAAGLSGGGGAGRGSRARGLRPRARRPKPASPPGGGARAVPSPRPVASGKQRRRPRPRPQS